MTIATQNMIMNPRLPMSAKKKRPDNLAKPLSGIPPKSFMVSLFLIMKIIMSGLAIQAEDGLLMHHKTF
jgi:hypothetical protein